MKNISFAVVGTNFVTDFFMNAVQTVKGIDVIAACSLREESRNKFTKRYGVQKTFHDYRELAKVEDLDAVYLAVPNYLHHEMTMYFLNRNISVFCEKPLGVNPIQVQEMIDMSRMNQVLLFDGIVPLYSKNFVVLKNNLDKIGRLRKAVFAFSHYSSRYDAYLRGENPTTFRLDFCNGSLLDMGVYCVALAVGLFGKSKETISNLIKLSSGVDCMGTSIMVYDDIEVVIMHSKVTDSCIQSEIQGENGIITFGMPNRLSNIYLHTKDCSVNISSKTENSFREQLLDFQKNFNNNRFESDIVSHELSLMISEVLYEIRKQSGIHYPCYGELGYFS